MLPIWEFYAYDLIDCDYFAVQPMAVSPCPQLDRESMKVGRIFGDTLSRVPVFGSFLKAVQERYRRFRLRLREKKSNTNTFYAKPFLTKEIQKVWTKRQTVAAWLDQQRSGHQPVNIFPIPDDRLRLTIVTDSVGKSSLFGGVGTALILGTLLANRLGATLRLATLNEPPDAGALRQVLSAANIELQQPFEAVFTPPSGKRSLSVSEQDCFLSTSWWTTRALLSSINRERLCYILQEDERMFYPFNDERLRCQHTLQEPGVFVAMNTHLLYHHLTSGPYSIPGLAERSCPFEPAFPGHQKDSMPRQASPTGRRQLFFYARPNHPRNLFCAGLDALSAAILQGVFTPRDWDIQLVGSHMPDLEFPCAMEPKRVEGLSWNEYNAFVRTIDAGFVLMDTPHPSYPPLDLAAAGAAVLTNRHGSKQDLGNYSANIIMADTDHQSLVDGLKELAEKACDNDARSAAMAADGICRDWTVSLEDIVERMAAHYIGGVAVQSSAQHIQPVSSRKLDHGSDTAA